MRLLSFILLVVLLSCNGNKENKSAPSLPSLPVTEEEKYITPEYIDSLNKNRQQRLVDLRRALNFDCLKELDGKSAQFKIKVYPDGSYADVEVLENTEIEINYEAVKACVDNYFSKNTKLNFGELKDLPGSGKTTNKHPHVYTLLIY